MDEGCWEEDEHTNIMQKNKKSEGLGMVGRIGYSKREKV